MAAGGVALGLSSETAARLAAATLVGAGRLLEQSDVDAAELRRRVTSPGGTTAAALAVMEAEGLPATVARAERAAAERSRELSAQG
jgi:pyrroline-5-carboxylate reductase